MHGSGKFAYARDGQLGLLTGALRSETGLKIDEVDEDGRTLLHWASSGGHLDMVELLLTTYKADPNTADEEQWTPLLSASSAGALPVVRRLVAAGARLDARTSAGGTPLHYAASKGREHVAAFLVEQGASLTATDKRGDTPLHKAARSPSVAKMLLAKGASPNKTNKTGRTALHEAAEDGKGDVCKLLLEAGADADLVDQEGATPRMLGGQALEDIWPRAAK